MKKVFLLLVATVSALLSAKAQMENDSVIPPAMQKGLY